MNLRSVFLAVASASCLTTSAFAKAVGPGEILAPVEKVFIPNGFDDNDVTEVLVHGEFPNSCYQVGEGGYVVNKEQKKILVWVKAYKYDSLLCAQVMTPYLKSIKVGILEKGTYEVRVENAPSILESFEVEARTVESPDDYLYAPVYGGNIETDENGRQFLNLVGTYPHTFWGCLKIKEVKMELGENNVLVVLPIMETLSEEQCGEDYSHDFNQTYGLPQPMLGKGALHVRSINGESYNRFIHIK
ncbi:MAG: hypothetical protein R3B45_07990 [Bdellovibrionota bacterium]